MEPDTCGDMHLRTAQHDVETQQMEAIEMTTGSGDWLNEEFKRADQALDCLPTWAQPVVTRLPLAQPGEEYPAHADHDGASVASESPADQPG